MAAQTMHANICFAIFCEAQEGAFDRFSVKLVLFLVRYMNVCLASKDSQMRD